MSVHNNPSHQTSFVQDVYSSSFNVESKREPKENIENQLDTQAENGLSPELPTNKCFAESTYLQIDEQGAKRLNKLKEKTSIAKIVSWIGYDRNYLHGKGDKLSVRDARLINQYSNRSIFEINEDHLLEFKVIKPARKILETLVESHNFSESARNLNLDPTFLHRVKNEKILSISKENADNIEKLFGENVFYIYQIFRRACIEDINEGKPVVPNSALLTYVSVDQEGKNKISDLPPDIKTKLAKILGPSIYKICHTMTVRNAFVFNEVAGSKIVSLSTKNLAYVPISNETQDQLNELIQKKIKDNCLSQRQLAKDMDIRPATIISWKKGRKKTATYDTAGKVNAYFGVCLFDFKKLINDAKLDAAAFYKTLLQKPSEIKPLATEVQRKERRKKIESTESPVNKEKVDQSGSREESKYSHKQNLRPVNDTMLNAAPFFPFSGPESDLPSFGGQLRLTEPLDTQAQPQRKRKSDTNIEFFAKRPKVDPQTTNEESTHVRKLEFPTIEKRRNDYTMLNSPSSFYPVSDLESGSLFFEKQQQFFRSVSTNSLCDTTSVSTDGPESGETEDLTPIYENIYGSTPLLYTASPYLDPPSPTQLFPGQDATDSEFKFFP